jgi:phosphate transport system substrate-binding protein
MNTIKEKNKMTLVATMLVILGVAIFSGCIGTDQGTTLVIDGSTTVFPIAQAEAERYMDEHGDIDIQVTGTGSANGISAVGSGKVDIGMSSREIKSSEMAAYPDVVFVNTTIAIDGIAIIVHPSNSVSNLTLSQVKGIYNGTITSWGELGGGSGNIVLVGRDSASGTREYFYEHVMGKEDASTSMLEKNSNGLVHDTVAGNKYAIGYVGLGYVTNQVKGINMQNKQGDYLAPTIQNVIDGEYPVWRYLYLYTNGPATGLAKEFIDFILSEEGQQIARDQGFVPII